LTKLRVAVSGLAKPDSSVGRDNGTEESFLLPPVGCSSGKARLFQGLMSLYIE